MARMSAKYRDDCLRRVVRHLLPKVEYGRMSRSIGVLQTIRKEGYAVARKLSDLDGTETEIRLRELRHPFRLRRIQSHPNVYARETAHKELATAFELDIHQSASATIP